MIEYHTQAEMAPHRARFDGGYKPDGIWGCWVWARGLTTTGYGHFSIGSRYFQAHRLAYIVAFGSIPDGLYLDHLCRNRACVNPTHLEPVTHRENIRRGSGSVLTPQSVRYIRARIAAGIGQRALAREMGINHSTISRVIGGSLWSDVDAKRKEQAA